MQVGMWQCRKCATLNADAAERCTYCHRHRKNDFTVQGLAAVIVIALIFFAVLFVVLHRIYG